MTFYFSVGQGEVLTKEIPNNDEEIRITNGWSKGRVLKKGLLYNEQCSTKNKSLRTIKVKNQRGSIGFVPTPLLQELHTE